MRWTTVAGVGAALAVALVTASTASATAVRASSAPPGNTESCYAFAVSALASHVVVRRRPPACAGLPQAIVNQDVARAIRTVVGPLPKARARQVAAADSHYLANLVRPARPPRAVSVATGTTTTSGDLALRFSALAAWLAAALAGAFLLLGLLKRDWRRRPPLVPLSHAGLAMTGLLIWIAFTVTTVAALAWADVGLTWVIAGLGMATLLGGPDQQASSGTESAAPGEQARSSTAAFPSRTPVIVIALHGVLATLTILFVLLAAIGIG